LLDEDRGVPEEELKKRYAAAMKSGDYSRLVVYSGTGAGLVNKSQSVSEILEEVELEFEEQANEAAERLKHIAYETRHITYEEPL
jgi:NAD(P)H-dependent flavin oxidoreductase YrpB (nitropropane dioxygenase family)